MIRCLRVGFREHSDERPELAQRVIGYLVVMHRRSLPERRAVGDLAERAAGGGMLGCTNVPPVKLLTCSWTWLACHAEGGQPSILLYEIDDAKDAVIVLDIRRRSSAYRHS